MIKMTKSERNINFWYGVLSFCIPLIGLILQIVWYNKRPMTAQVCMKSWILGISLNIMVFLGELFLAPQLVFIMVCLSVLAIILCYFETIEIID